MFDVVLERTNLKRSIYNRVAESSSPLLAMRRSFYNNFAYPLRGFLDIQIINHQRINRPETNHRHHHLYQLLWSRQPDIVYPSS